MTLAADHKEQTSTGRALVASPQPATKVRSFSFADDIVMLSEPSGPRAEAIRGVRTFLLGQHVNAGRRALAICAASEGVGATFLAANLAVAFAQVGVKVLLIDGDLKGGGLTAMIRPSEEPLGLADALRAEGGFHDFVQPEVIRNLSLMYAGTAGSDGKELLAAGRFDDCLERCMRDYDLTILDAPPANTSTDVRRLAAVAGYGVIVARRHKTFVSDLATLAEQLTQERAVVVGTVLNDG